MNNLNEKYVHKQIRRRTSCISNKLIDLRDVYYDFFSNKKY